MDTTLPSPDLPPAALAERFDVVTLRVELTGRVLELWRPRSADDLISEEDFAVDERIPYWAEIWPAARVLAQEVVRHAGSGKRCLELGCGAGLVAATALAAGYDVLATDYYADALEFTTANAARNGLPAPEIRVVDWRVFPHDLGQYDTVLAADVLYEPAYSPLVARAIAKSLKPGGLAWLADPVRRHAERFPAEAQAAGLTIVHQQRVTFRDETRAVDVDLYQLSHSTT